MAELEASLVLYFTGLSRDSATIIEDQSNLLKDGHQESLDAMHTLKKDSVKMKESILKGDIQMFSEIMGRSWEAKKRTSKHIANEVIENAYNLAISSGAYAGKVSGAGGGGFMMFLVDPVRRPDVIRKLSQSPGHIMTCHFTKEGSTAWRTNGRG